MQRDEIIARRAKLLRGNPYYEKDAMGNFRREKGGTPGLHEMQKMGDFNPLAAIVRMMIDNQIATFDHMLERERDDDEQEAKG